MSLPPPDLPRLARRARDTSKRDYGRVLVVGGATGMAGAPALAAMAALRGGAGLVDLAAPAPAAAIAATFDPCFMAHPLPAAADGTFAADAVDRLAALAERADVLAVGPGIGRGDAVGAIVERLWRGFPGPAVFDADALWWLARGASGGLAAHAGPRILTPHAGEMRRFLGEAATGPEPARGLLEAAASRLADETGTVILLKGPDTLVTDGRRRARNATGNPGMASGGMGDVLTGLIAALLRQPAASAAGPACCLEPFEAAGLGAWVHGRAGDLAAEAIGEISLTARDVVAFIPAALAVVVAA
ncbi:MAG: NAD(P)H-hydrate dehydratase [Planctomycetaceae bacterium]